MPARNALFYAIERLYIFITRPGPPKPKAEVEELLESVGLMPKNLLQLYKVFHTLAQDNDSAVKVNAAEINTIRLIDLVRERKEWVSGILNNLLQLGGIGEKMDWDNFLYFTLRYTSLSKVELCQTMFYIITKEVKSWTVHYVTSMQLQEFYDKYRNCPINSFCTKNISFFGHLPLTRYYVSDYVELCHRFAELINPAIHLQRSFQAVLPSMDFWNNYDRVEVANRQITLDFFTMRKTHIFIKGVPAFRESCDMLMPDAYGGHPINHDQWKLRAPHYDPAQGVWPKPPGAKGAPQIPGQAPPGGQLSPLMSAGQSMMPVPGSHPMMSAPGGMGNQPQAAMAPGAYGHSQASAPAGSSYGYPQTGAFVPLAGGAAQQPPVASVGGQLPPHLGGLHAASQSMGGGAPLPPAVPGVRSPLQQGSQPLIPLPPDMLPGAMPPQGPYGAQQPGSMPAGSFGAQQPGSMPGPYGQQFGMVPGQVPMQQQQQQGYGMMPMQQQYPGYGSPDPRFASGTRATGITPVAIKDQLLESLDVKSKPAGDTADLSQVPAWVREYATIPVKANWKERFEESAFISVNRQPQRKSKSQVQTLFEFNPQELLDRPQRKMDFAAQQ